MSKSPEHAGTPAFEREGLQSHAGAGAAPSDAGVDEQPLSSSNSYAALELALSRRPKREAGAAPPGVAAVAPVALAVGAFPTSIAADEQPLSSSNSCATLVAQPAVATVPIDDQFFTPSNSYAALALSPTSPVKPRRQYILPSHSMSRKAGAGGVAFGLGFPDAKSEFEKAPAADDEEDDISDRAATLIDTPSSSEAPSSSESDAESAGDDATSQVRDTAATPALDETAPTWALAHKRPALEFWGNVTAAVILTALAIVWTCFAAMPQLIEKVDNDGWTAYFQLEAGCLWSFVTLLWLQAYRRQYLWLVVFENMALASSFVVGIGGYAALALGTQYVFARMTEAKEGGGELAATAVASCNSSVSL